MEKVNCIICDSNASSPSIKVSDRFTGEWFQIVKCGCGFKFLSPRPKYKEIASYYEDASYDPHRSQNMSTFDRIYSWVQVKALKWKFRHISRFISNGKLLDVGGGGGHFCSYFQSRGWQASLQDNSEKARLLAQKNNISAYAELAELESQKFNLITMWHSLEHIHGIDQLFIDIDRLISEDGILVIAVPNVNAPERKILGINWAPWDAPRHLYHFDYNQLSKLLLKHGWEIQLSKTMLQDTPYNILLSLKSNSPIQLIFGGFLLLYSIIKAVIGSINSASSFMVICKKI